jgi:hypothetical protein
VIILSKVERYCCSLVAVPPILSPTAFNLPIMSPSISLASQAICILSLLPLITSAPIEELLDSRKALQSFAITQVPNPNWTGTKGLGPAALLRTYYKYGAQPPSAARKAVDNSSGTVTASPYPSEYDREYLSPVSLGTPAQILDLDFDTGSSDLYNSRLTQKPFLLI